ncbi:MAG: response regulator [Proteobacteria bacterium]|nr:response regulator [Pseudomonadota bacterium]
MTLNRLIAGLLVLAFNTWAIPDQTHSGAPILAALLYLVLGLVIGVHLALRPAPSTERRIVAMLVDIGSVSYELHIGGSATAWLIPGYLWTVFGNGFRFGPRFLLAAMGSSIVGFGMVAATTPFWSRQPSMLIGVVIGLIILPLYALALIRRLSAARQQAEAASRAKSLFLASVSHELRTPLNAIIGMGALLEGSRLDPGQAEMSGTIMTAARSLLRLIDGILDLSRIEAERMPVTEVDFDLVRELREIRTIFLAQARQKGLRLHLHVSPRTPLLLRGDASRLHEIMLNLVGNALKFTDSGSITIAVDAVDAGAPADGTARLAIEVTDTGIGIAPEAQGRIFENFTQADETILNRYGGTGLGLGITRKFVELLGGRISVRSTPGTGSTFRIELPFALRPEAPLATTGEAVLRAFVPGAHTGTIAPLLGRLRQAGVLIERIDAWPPGLFPPDASAPVTHSAQDRPDAAAPWRGGCVVAFAALDPRGEAGFAHLHATGALAFVVVGGTPFEALPPPAWQRMFLTLLPTVATDAQLAALLHLLHGMQERPGGDDEQAFPVAQESFHILVADDNAVNRRVLLKILGASGHTVVAVSDGEQALDALAEQAFDIALFDVNMPKVDGIEATKIYRMASLGRVSVPIVALTADATPENRARCLEAGMRDCLVKPVEPAKLLAILDEAVAAARREVPLAWRPTAQAPKRPSSPHPAPPPAAPALDGAVLDSLRALGGDEFIDELGASFCAEAHARLEALRAAAAAADAQEFRTHAHGLRSIAANIGAQPLGELCLPYQTVSAAELQADGASYVTRIAAELKRVETTLGRSGDTDQRPAADGPLAPGRWPESGSGPRPPA